MGGRGLVLLYFKPRLRYNEVSAIICENIHAIPARTFYYLFTHFHRIRFVEMCRPGTKTRT